MPIFVRCGRHFDRFYEYYGHSMMMLHKRKKLQLSENALNYLSFLDVSNVLMELLT